MRKLITTLLFLVALFSANVQAAEPISFTIDDVTYVSTGATTAGVKDVKTDLATIIIPETVANNNITYTVTSVEYQAFYYCDATYIELPNTVTEIKEQGISTCSNLVNLKLSTNLKKLDRFAFYNCKKLTTITLPEGIEAIPASCFAQCEALTTIILPSSIKSIANGAFYKTPITEFTFPALCESVGSNAFQLCPNLNKVTLNSSITSFGEGAFRSCVQLTSVNLEAAKQLSKLSDLMFLDCEKLTDIIIPINIKEFGISVFSGTNISAFKIDADNKNLVIIDEAIYSSDKKMLHAFPSKSLAKTYVVIDGCIGIGGGAFENSSVKKITLPDGIRALDKFAFCNSMLEEINFPASLVFMGEQALAGTQFTSITLPENMIDINYALLAMSLKLQSVTIPASIKTIYSCAFKGCTALREVHCLGAIAPYLELYDEDDNPFGYIDRDIVDVTVPKGRIEAYKKEGWDTFSKFADTEKAVLLQSAITPENNSELKEIGAIEITFPDATTVVTMNPDVKLSKGQELYGTIVPVDGWMAVNNSSDKKTVTVFPADYDSFLSPVKLENQEKYYVEIPANTFKNEANEFNQKIVLHYVGKIGSSVEDITGSNDCFVIKEGGRVHVKLGDLQNCTVQLYNINGMLLETIEKASNLATFNTQTEGILIIHVISNKTIKTFKVM